MKLIVLTLIFSFMAMPATAESIPAFALDKEYQTCMSGPSNGLPQQKKAYCLCIRNKLAAMDIDSFMKMGREAAALGVGNPAPALQEMAQECIAQSLR